jgi:hypothetical protein
MGSQIGKWVVLNPKMGSSKIEFWRENAELSNVKVSKHSIFKRLSTKRKEILMK